MTKKKKYKPFDSLLEISPELDAQLCKHIADYEGQGPILSAAFGALIVGQHYGMDALRMIHTPATLRKYQKALGIEYADYCPARTHLTQKSHGVKIAEKLGGAWKVITGKVKVKGKGDVTATGE